MSTSAWSLIQLLVNVTAPDGNRIRHHQNTSPPSPLTTRRTQQAPCLSSAHLASSAPRADSSRSSPASPRPHYSSARSLPRPRARAATHTATHTTRLPDGSSASSLVRRRRRRAGRTSSTTASLAPLLSALLATGSSRTPGRLWRTAAVLHM